MTIITRGANAAWLTRALAVGALATLALTACGDGGDGDGSSSGGPLDLEGKSFTATEVYGLDPVAGTTIELTFEDGRVSGRAGCNTVSGGATWADQQLVLEGPLASTMMACDAALEDQDQWLIGLLESEPALSLDGGILVVGTDANGMTMEES